MPKIKGSRRERTCKFSHIVQGHLFGQWMLLSFPFGKPRALSPWVQNFTSFPREQTQDEYYPWEIYAEVRVPGQSWTRRWTASSSITGEGLLIRVKEGSKLNVKVLSHMDGSQQIYKSGSWEQIEILTCSGLRKAAQAKAVQRRRAGGW